jgi:hypothetical protein
MNSQSTVIGKGLVGGQSKNKALRIVEQQGLPLPLLFAVEGY